MRIAYVCVDPGVPIFGHKGCSVHVQEVVRAIQKRGDQVEIFATRFGKELPNDMRDTPRHRFDVPAGRDRRKRERQLVEINQELKQQLAALAPFDLVYERFSLWSYAAMESAKSQSIPGVLEVNSPLIQEQKKHRWLFDERLARRLERTCFRNASRIVAVSQGVAEYLQTDPFARAKTRVIPNGVNTNLFQPRPLQKSSKNKRQVVIGFVGTLKPWHGVSLLIEAFAKLNCHFPNAVLRIVGDGPERVSLLNQLGRYPRQVQRAVEWTGAVRPSRMSKKLRSFDIAVAPYPHLDNFYFSPLKILEYMASGLPIVASRIGQIPSLIQDGVHGRLCDPGCVESLAQTLFGLCKDPDIRNRLGASAREKATRDHTWDKTVSAIIDGVELSHAVPSAGEV